MDKNLLLMAAIVFLMWILEGILLNIITLWEGA